MRPKAFENFPAELRLGYGPYMAVVDGVHDGDTLAIRADVGLDAFPAVWVRLKSRDGSWVDAPELSQHGGHETREYLCALVPYETPCVASTNKLKGGDEQRSFVRFVGTIELSGGRDLGTMVNEWLKDKGFPAGKGGLAKSGKLSKGGNA